jgi:hypothetical protein
LLSLAFPIRPSEIVWLYRGDRFKVLPRPFVVLIIHLSLRLVVLH